jgi:2-methylcitrate dehydratase PrpD
MKGITERLAAFTSTCDASAIPQRARDEATRAVVDVAGTMLAGAAEPLGNIVRDHARREGGNGPSAVVGGGFRTSASLAALANGSTGHALDYDDIGLDVGHPTVAVAPAALAVGEEVGASGRQLLDAMVIGYDIASRVGSCLGSVGGPYRRGYHGTSVYGIFGATAAAARLLDLDEEQIRCAFGIAASEASGVRVNFGTMTKPYHAGSLNRSAVTAALLAGSGFTAHADAFEERFGWGDVIGGTTFDDTGIVDNLGDTFAIEEGVQIKLYPCCGGNHRAIEGVKTMMSMHGLEVKDVERLEVQIDAQVANEILMYPWPATGLEGKFSLAYNVAAALVDGDVTVDTFVDERIHDYDWVRSKIAITPIEGYRKAVTLHADTAGGGRISWEQTSLPGTPEQPVTAEDVDTKFRANAARMLKPDDVAKVSALLWDLESQSTLTELTDVLMAGRAQ